MRDSSDAPLVSVIVPAYNAMPHIVECVTSVIEQTLEANRIELIVVDDGSTDGTGDELDRMAGSHSSRMRVVHQANSGGPSAPRNVGLEQARGRYVFFLDADDYLGLEALARLVESAETNGSDIVLGKMKGVGGRRPPASMFTENQPDVDLFASRVYWSLSALKLFHRDLIDRLHLRFSEDLLTWEDLPFTAVAYLNARRISVVADYDCYYAAYREGGKHMSESGGVEPRVSALKRMIEVLGARVEAGPRRDLLLRRHFEVEMTQALRCLIAESDSGVREREFARIVALVSTNHNTAIDAQLHPMVRLQLHLVNRGLLTELAHVIRFHSTGQSYSVLAENGRAYATYPYFRDAALDVPDACFDLTSRVALSHSLHGVDLDLEGRVRITGHAYLVRIDHVQADISLILRRRGGDNEQRITAERIATKHLTEQFGEGLHDYDRVGFDVSIDLAALTRGGLLTPGTWDLYVAVTVNGLTGTARLGHHRRAEVDDRPVVREVRSPGTNAARALVITAYFTRTYGNLSIQIAETSTPE
ncbi:MAG: glycosyltransferase [Chloroflexota bacterium]|nr:glycosyltransferase [Chloroflexota bacterium]